MLEANLAHDSGGADIVADLGQIGPDPREGLLLW